MGTPRRGNSFTNFHEYIAAGHRQRDLVWWRELLSVCEGSTKPARSAFGDLSWHRLLRAVGRLQLRRGDAADAPRPCRCGPSRRCRAIASLGSRRFQAAWSLISIRGRTCPSRWSSKRRGKCATTSMTSGSTGGNGLHVVTPLVIAKRNTPS
jgi:hypothetical protein